MFEVLQFLTKRQIKKVYMILIAKASGYEHRSFENTTDMLLIRPFLSSFDFFSQKFSIFSIKFFFLIEKFEKKIIASIFVK